MILKNYFKMNPLFIGGFLLIILFFCNSCTFDIFFDTPESEFKKMVVRSSLDGVVDQNEKEVIIKYLNENSKTDDFANLVIDNELLNKKIREISGKTDLEIWNPESVIIPKLGKIRFYIETSMSMGGYLNGGTEFQNTVNYLIGDLRQGYNTINFVPNTIDKKITNYKDVDAYADDLTTSKLHIGGHSPLHEAFKIIIDRADSNDINFFATDGIMSGSDQQIAHNPNFNIEFRSRLLTSIKACFEEVKNDFGMSVYAFRSRFNSNPHKGYYYFTFNNTRIASNFSDRPFYIFVFGNKYLMDTIRTYIDEETKFVKPIEILHFGTNQKPIKSYALFNNHQLLTMRNCMFPDQRTIKCNIEPSDQDIVHFAVGLNLSDIPEYAREADYLNRNVVIEHSNEITLKHDAFKTIDQDFIKSLHPAVQQFILKEGCTHYIDIYVNHLFSLEEIISLKIKKNENKWYEEWSCDNDQNIKTDVSIQKKTFNFKYMIYGIRDAFKNDDNMNFVDVKIKIIND